MFGVALNAMPRLLLCTSNPGKRAELHTLLPARFELLVPADLGLDADLPEDGATLEENALQKAREGFLRSGLPSVADDSGLEVDALGGAPGVRSARYAGEAKDPRANMRKLLQDMKGRQDRGARFRTVMAYVDGDVQRTFAGEVKGSITQEARGSGGFGYDPVFQPYMSELTFAEMSPARKNAISHRAHAAWKLARWLEEHHRER